MHFAKYNTVSCVIPPTIIIRLTYTGAIYRVSQLITWKFFTLGCCEMHLLFVISVSRLIASFIENCDIPSMVHTLYCGGNLLEPDQKVKSFQCSGIKDFKFGSCGCRMFRWKYRFVLFCLYLEKSFYLLSLLQIHWQVLYFSDFLNESEMVTDDLTSDLV